MAAKAGESLDQFYNTHRRSLGRECDNGGAGIAGAKNVTFGFEPLVGLRIAAPRGVRREFSHVDRPAAPQAGSIRLQNGSATDDVRKSGLVLGESKHNADVDHRLKIEIGQTVEDGTSQVIVGARENDVARSDRIAHDRRLHERTDRAYLASQSELGNCVSEDIRLLSACVCITLGSSVQSMEIRNVDDIGIDENEVRNAQSCQKHCRCGPGSATSDDGDAQLSDVGIEARPEGECLTLQRWPILRDRSKLEAPAAANRSNLVDRRATYGFVEPNSRNQPAIGSHQQATTDGAFAELVQRVGEWPLFTAIVPWREILKPRRMAVRDENR